LTSSDNFGDNPLHEFGQVFNQATLPILPYWRLEGDASVTQDFVRVVPDRQSKRGGLWNAVPNNYENWEMVFKVRISGSSQIGADGLAMWLVSNPSPNPRDFFGFKEKFIGLGIIIDTYDNDKSGKHPKMIGVLNDGTKSFTHSHSNTEGSMELGNCYFALRNQPPVNIRVTYSNKELTIIHESGNTRTSCFSARDIYIPTGYYFGFTAATGQLADDHDVYAVALRNLDHNAGLIDSLSTYGRQVNIHQISGILSKIEYAFNQKYEISTMASNCPTIPSQPSEVKCDTSDIQKEALAINNNFHKFNDKIDEILKATITIQNEIKKNTDNSQISVELYKIESMISSVKHTSKIVEDITSDRTGSILWIVFCVFIILVLVYIVRVFYIMRRERSSF